MIVFCLFHVCFFLWQCFCGISGVDDSGVRGGVSDKRFAGGSGGLYVSLCVARLFACATECTRTTNITRTTYITGCIQFKSFGYIPGVGSYWGRRSCMGRVKSV